MQVNVAVQALLCDHLTAEETAPNVDDMAAKIATVIEAAPVGRRAATAAQLYFAIRLEATQAKPSGRATAMKETYSSEQATGSGLIRSTPHREPVQLQPHAQEESWLHPKPRGKTSPGGIDVALHGAPDQFCLCVRDLAQSAKHAMRQVCTLHMCCFQSACAMCKHRQLTPFRTADIAIL